MINQLINCNIDDSNIIKDDTENIKEDKENIKDSRNIKDNSNDNENIIDNNSINNIINIINNDKVDNINKDNNDDIDNSNINNNNESNIIITKDINNNNENNNINSNDEYVKNDNNKDNTNNANANNSEDNNINDRNKNDNNMNSPISITSSPASIISIPSSLDEITSTTIQRVFSSPEVKEVLTTPELLLHIFSFLPVPALINNCRLVSRFWCRIVNIPPKIIAHINSLKKTKIHILAETTIYDHSTSVSIVGAYTNETRATNQLIRNYIDGVISYAPEYSPDGYSSDGFDGSVGFVGGDEVRSTGRRDRLGREGLVWELKSITLDTKVEVVEEKDYDEEDYEYLWE